MPATVVTDAIIEYVASRIAYNVRKTTLKREVSIILYGEVGSTGQPKKKIYPGNFEKICSKAREMLRLRAAVNTAEARDESIGFYDNLISDDTVSARVKMKARTNLDKIQGVADHKGFNIPITNIHQVLDIEKLDLTLEEKKLLLKVRQKIANSNA